MRATMDILLDKINIVLLITTLLNLFLGFIIFFNGRNKKINIIYSLNIVTIIGWIVGMILFRSAPQETSIFWCTVLYIAPTLIASSFLYFTYIFPTKTDSNVLLKSILIFLINAIVIVMIAWPELIIKEVNIRPSLEKEIIFTKFYWFYFLYIAGFFSYGFQRLFKKYLKSTGIGRLQVIYLLLGYAIAANLAFVTNLIMPWIGYFFLNWLGQVFTIIMVGFASYAIIRYRLMGIRLAVKRSTVFSAIVIALTAVYAMAAFLLSWIFFGGAYTLKTQIITGLMVALLVAIVFRPLYEWLRRTTDTFLFKGEYQPQELMADISDVLSRTLDLETVVNTLKEKIIRALRVSKMEVVILEEGKITQSHHEMNFDFSSSQRRGLKKIVEYLKKQREALVLEELKREYAEKAQSARSPLLIRELEKLKAALVVPLSVKEKLVGLFLLQAKKSGDMFTNEDIKTLEAIAAQAAVAIENARLYEEMKDFSRTLQKEVNRQTKELREANIRLQQLDKAKSEFISLASHQLRTPLSIIKGYISMLLEGTWGDISEKQKEYLEKVYANNERLIKLVDDLLTVSRIESGRLEFDYQILDLSKLVQDIVKEFSQLAEKKGLYLKYVQPAQALPKVKADSLKIRQVIQNLIDNAIHYTKKGGATIKLKAEKNKVIFSIEDTGIGISAEEQVNLFEKFSRGRGVTEMHTEGTGLGLYLAAKLVKAHHGRIWVESAGKDKGSTFYFELPIK